MVVYIENFKVSQCFQYCQIDKYLHRVFSMLVTFGIKWLKSDCSCGKSFEIRQSPPTDPKQISSRYIAKMPKRLALKTRDLNFVSPSLYD